MRVLLVVVAAIVLLAVAAVALAPASLVAPAVSSATSGRIALADVEGTLWRGAGTLVGADGSRLPLAWRTDAVALARGTIRVQFAPRGSGAKPRGEVVLDDGALHARDVSIAVPAAWIVDVIGAKLPVAASGDVDVTIAALDWASRDSGGEARVEWDRARLSAPGLPPVDLGEVTATLAASGGRLAGPLRNDGGALAVAGDVAAFANGGGEANLLLTPRPGDDALARVLAAIGTPEAGGYRVRARWQAR